MTSPETEDVQEGSTFGRNLVRVLIIQIVALLVLGALQARYHVL
jgi:hypothetical protein